MSRRLWLGLLLTAVPAAAVWASDSMPIERGKRALFEKSYTAAMWSTGAYENAWKQWGVARAPKEYAQAFMDYYGLHPAPFNNGPYPMGLREGSNFLGKGLTADCMLCHAGSILGKSYIGMPNSSLDIQAFFEDLGKASGGSGKTPFIFSNVRGTFEAGSMAVYLLQYREPDLSIRLKPLDLGLRQDLCEDVPAWWLLKKKKTMYHTGTAHAKSVRSIMQFMLTPTNTRADFERAEDDFRDIQAYIFSLEPPRYPFPIDKPLAESGQKLFVKNCAKCHGTYGEKWTYPNKVVPMEIIGTEASRFKGISAKVGELYNKSWFAQEKTTDGKGYPVVDAAGYQAPPLDGIWATAPYFHNGSVPTLYHVLNSTSRPKIFTRSYRTGKDDYDAVNVGWKIEVLAGGTKARATPYEARKIYNTTLPGRGNGGHTFGDELSDEERRAVIEYLKTL